MEIPFCGPTQEGRLTLVSGQRSINLYPKVEGAGSKNKVSLYSTPGLPFLTSISSGSCRSNGVKFGVFLFFVVGNALISIDSAGTALVRGTLSTSNGRVSLVAGRTVLGLVDGTAGYFWNGSTFTTISDPDFPVNATHISYLDGFFVVNKPGTGQFQINTTADDITAWSALDFATAQARPDDITSLISTAKDLYFFGPESMQLFYNSGNVDFPFEPYPNGVITVGIQAPHSLVQNETGVYFLAVSSEGGLYVAKAVGLQLEKLSTDEIDWQLNQYATTSDAIGWLENEGGRTYYVLTLPSADKTYCYDINNPRDMAWFEKKSVGIGRWRANGFGALGKRRIIGDYTNNNFYELDFNTYTENGAVIERERYSQVVYAERKNVIVNKLVFDMQVGVGTVSGQGVAPVMLLRYSHDGGKTWSSELSKSIGALGDYTAEVEYNKLGEGRQWFFHLKITDPVAVNILGAYGDIEVLGH